MTSLLELLTLKFARREEGEERRLLLPDYGLNVAILEKLNYPTDSEINNYGINGKIISMYDSDDARRRTRTPHRLHLRKSNYGGILVKGSVCLVMISPSIQLLGKLHPCMFFIYLAKSRFSYRLFEKPVNLKALLRDVIHFFKNRPYEKALVILDEMDALLTRFGADLKDLEDIVRASSDNVKYLFSTLRHFFSGVVDEFLGFKRFLKREKSFLFPDNCLDSADNGRLLVDIANKIYKLVWEEEGGKKVISASFSPSPVLMSSSDWNSFNKIIKDMTPYEINRLLDGFVSTFLLSLSSDDDDEEGPLFSERENVLARSDFNFNLLDFFRAEMMYLS